MKPGEKVWVFDGGDQVIKHQKVIHTDGKVIVTGRLGEDVRVYLLNFDCFLTREALCEHYRKIFE
jgi:hypothetical protein